MKQRRYIGDLITGALALIGIGPPLLAAPPPEKPASAYVRDIRPLLSKYCFACHGPTKPKGGLNLEPLQGQENPREWKHVWDRVKSRQMPPSDRPQPTTQERERITAWVEEVFAKHTLDGQPDPGPLRPRRMNVREHMNTLRDLAVSKGGPQPRRATYAPKPDGSVSLYQAIIPPPEHQCAFVPRTLPTDTNDGGFDTIEANLSIPPLLMEKYLRCSKLLLDDAFTLNPKQGESYQWPLYHEMMRVKNGPWPKGSAQHQVLIAFLRAFAGRAFRRPVTDAEVEKYAMLFEKAQAEGQDFETSIRLPIQAILVSPRFVILWAEASRERQRPEQTVRPLDDWELATRLSYFLWSSLPDQELVQLAQKGRLQDPEILEQQVRRMLKDRRITDGLLKGFLCQWLQLEKLERAAPDAEQFPGYFQNNLAELMTQEVLLFVDIILVEDRSILEFIDADWGLMCYPLAQHYGIENFPGKKPVSNAQPPWYRIKYADRHRGGVMTMGKVLTGTSQPRRTSPVHRGKWILETMLGTPPPPPPPDVDNVLKEESDAGKKPLTVPQRMEKHRSNPACYSCHRMIDPLGIALETFDPTGRWRDRDQGQPIDARGTTVDGKEFNGVGELKSLLRSRKEDVVRNYTEQMLTYALGRKLEFYDAVTVKQITQAVAQDDYKFSRVVVEVVKSYPFRNRRVKEVDEKP